MQEGIRARAVARYFPGSSKKSSAVGHGRIEGLP